jgi:tRNA pseudouridine55 synthase
VTAEDFQNGQILLIDKPLHWTSFQAVNKMKWLLKSKLGLKKIKIGHAGTLDPLASGLLVVCTGKFTKKITELQGQEKEYSGTFFIGATTPSYDLETEVDETFPTDHITDELIRETTKQFLGEIDQKATDLLGDQKRRETAVRTCARRRGSRDRVTQDDHPRIRDHADRNA